MQSFGKFLQSGDWKGEKHVPVIHAPEKVSAGEEFEIKITIGDAVRHPNSFEHYIAWFKVFFHPEGAKFPIEIANFNFTTHGEGDNFTDPVGATSAKLSKSGTIYAISYCNIHGVWENSKEIVVE
ncbi:class II SORL domain-containing protein [Alkaliphilus hydrothermalis]|uniref:Superoxide reductase n=1 Tax=Alkaliphilus hydrothermalis TaxID=1482730 RepID=A0ABS2NPW8_9FIRM|nr:class II SORL domain-containing protein [Alkaliphilus hydrothermalis]MBM7614980.1 superoxide reductase [Alkaliphilus hydrothermalis]